MRRGLIAAAIAVLASAAVVTAAVAKTSGPAGLAQADCTAVSLGDVGPLTGPAAFLGNEQLSWLKFAVSKYNEENGTKFKVAQGDTQLKAPVARTVARKFVADKSIMAIIGPSESQAVIAGAGLFEKAALAAISESATRVDLTNGQFKTFFRVIPHDGIQVPTVVRFVAEKLKSKHVVVIDSQDDYSKAIAGPMTKGFRARGIDVDRESVAATDTDFSSIVANVANDVSVVVFATQVASAANTLSQQLREQGKKAVVFGTDGAYSPAEYKPKLGYVSAFAPDLHFDPKARAIIREYNTFSKNRTFGTFGPPAYMAGWVAMTAITKACADGKATRAEVTKFVRQTNIPSIIGNNIRFTAKGDVRGATFAVFKVTNGKYSVAS